MTELDDVLKALGLGPRKALVPGALATFATIEEPTAPATSGNVVPPLHGAVQRMAFYDSLPPEWRQLAQEYGLQTVAQQWDRLRSKNAEKARQAIEVEKLMRAIKLGHEMGARF